MQNYESLIKSKSSPVFLISRTDSIGDVVLTLPMAGVLKSLYPDSKIIFLGKTYTKPIVDCCSYVDEFLNWDTIKFQDESKQINIVKDKNIDVFIHVFPNKQIAKLAKKAKIPFRIATSHRTYNWLYCNKLVNLSRKKSALHESQLNIKLIKCLGANLFYEVNELNNFIGIKAKDIPTPADSLIDKNRFNLILHPKSNSSAREWGVENFNNLISLLPQEDYNIFISGTKQEGDFIRESLINKNKEKVHDLTGLFSLEEFISFINKSDCLIAASTGPLHIASALGIKALGIYPPIRPMHPGRWKPIGQRTKVFCKEEECSICRKTKDCLCMKSISPKEVVDYLDSIKIKKTAN